MLIKKQHLKKKQRHAVEPPPQEGATVLKAPMVPAPSDEALPDLDTLLGMDNEADFPEEEASSAEPLYEWSPQTVAQGLAPERRQPEPEASERRQGWRRLVDQELISRAEQEAIAIREKAQQEGYEHGLEQGYQQAKQQIDHLRQQLEQLPELEKKALETLKEHLIPLAVQLAEKILHTEVSCDPDLVVHLADKLLHEIDPRQKQVVIKVHPHDSQRIRDEAANNAMWQLNDRQILVFEDASIQPGSCILETQSGQIDATFSTQLELMRKLFALDEASIKERENSERFPGHGDTPSQDNASGAEPDAEKQEG